jgi:sulfatase maturation enzyme AslB (radical SAM superfamily)
MSQSKSFCLIPWLHRFTNEQGFHQLCCSGVGPANTLRGADGKPLHINDRLTDEQLLNSPDLVDIRLAMLRGEWPEACERCRSAEASGSVSTRQHMGRRFQHRTSDVLEGLHEDGTISHPKVRYADIRLGNSCNLTCRMCGPWASRLWTEHFNEVQPRGMVSVESLTKLRDENWVNPESLRWLIQECLPTVDGLHFAGGEPFVIPEMVEVLETCISSGRSPEIDITYNTNITVLPEKVTKLWPFFHSVSVMCSIDGFGPLNDYIRRPSRWRDIERNLYSLDAHFKEWNLRRVSFNTTVQMYNILQLGELIDYLSTRFEHLQHTPRLTPLFRPEYLSISNLPTPVKRIAEERLLASCVKAATRLGSNDLSLRSSVDAVLLHMKVEGSQEHLEDFLRFTEKTDVRFGAKWAEACPDLWQLLRTHCETL